MNVKKENAIKAYEKGNEEVKKALKNLFPDIDFNASLIGMRVLVEGEIVQIDFCDGAITYTIQPRGAVEAFTVSRYNTTNFLKL